MAEGRKGTPLPSSAPFVGRPKEVGELEALLERAAAGHGGSLVLEGPPGIGKTLLARQVEERARARGVQVVWGHALKEVRTPFFALDQVFREGGALDPTSGPSLTDPLPSFTLMGEAKPDQLWEAVARAKGPCWVASRESPSAVRRQWPDLPAGVRLLWLSSGSGEDVLAPGNLDVLADAIVRHLRQGAGSIAGIAGLEYLVSQVGFSPVLRLVQLLREVAQEQQAHLLVSLVPTAFEPRQLSLLASEADTVLGDFREPGNEDPNPSSPTSRMMRYLDLLESAEQAAPLLLILDDLQWADPDSLKAFALLARNLRSLRVVLLATLRVGEGPSAAELHDGAAVELLRTLEQEGVLRRLPLGPVNESEARALSEMVLGLPLPPAEDRRYDAFRGLFERTAGNPFFLRESLLELRRGGEVDSEEGLAVLPRGAESWGLDMVGRARVPLSLQRLLSRRLAHLSPEERSVLEWAAVSGSAFELAPLSGASGSGTSGIRSALERLVDPWRILEPGTVGSRMGWTFSHPMLREVTLAQIPRERFQDIARDLAIWWADHRPEEVEQTARLFHDARSGSRGLAWIHRAMERTVRAHSLEGALVYYTWFQEELRRGGASAEDQGREGLRAAELWVERTGTSAQLGELLRSLDALELSSLVRLQLVLWDAWVRAFEDLPRARELLEQALSVPPTLAARGSPVPPAILARLGLVEATQLTWEGEFHRAREVAVRALALAETAPPWVHVVLLYYAGFTAATEGREEEARAILDRALPLAREEANPRLLAFCSSLEGSLAEVRGDLEAGRRATEASIEADRAAGDTRNMVNGLLNLTNLLVMIGDLTAARHALDEAGTLVRRFQIKDQAPLLLHREGELALREGKWGEARRAIEPALEELLTRGVRETTAYPRLHLAEACVGMGDLEGATRWLGQIPGNASPGDEGIDPAERALVEGQLHGRSGRAAEERRCYEEALATARQRRNPLVEASALTHLSYWDERHGEANLGQIRRKEAEALFDRCGVRPGGWIRSWPSGRSAD